MATTNGSVGVGETDGAWAARSLNLRGGRRALLALPLAALAARIDGGDGLARRRKRRTRKQAARIELDQQHLYANDGSFGYGLSDTFPLTQTFTVGLAGQLAQVGVILVPATSEPGTFQVTAEIFPLDETGAVDFSAGPLASGQVSTASVPTGSLEKPTLIDLSPRIAVAVDERLALRLRTDAPADYTWFGHCCDDPYPRGVAVEVPGGGADYYFQTFVAVGSGKNQTRSGNGDGNGQRKRKRR